MDRVKCAIVGASGYTGGELLRLLLSHPGAEISQVTSERMAGKLVFKAHPNLRKKTQLQFSRLDELRPCDLLFSCLPHGEAMGRFDVFKSIAPRIVDLSADFRLKSATAYSEWYGRPHARPELLGKFVYGIPELHREEMRSSRI